MQINPNASSNIYNTPSADIPPGNAGKPSSPDITRLSGNPFDARAPQLSRARQDAANRNADASDADKASNDAPSAEQPRTDTPVNQASGTPSDNGPMSSNRPNMPGKPTNPELDRKENLYDRAFKAAPALPDPATFVSDQLRKANNPDDPDSLDPEHTYLGYYNDKGEVVLGGSMLKYAMTQGLDGAPDGKDASELSFFKMRDGKHVEVKEDGTTTVSSNDVEPITATPRSVKNFSWTKDYHEAYTKKLNDTFDTYGIAMEGKFKMNYLRKLEQERDAGLITDEDRSIAQRAMGLNGGELYANLSLDDLKDKPPQPGIEINPLTINGHQGVNALVMTDSKTGRTVLYLGGMNGPFHGFENKDQMWNWICDKLKNPQTAQDLGRYFPDARKEMPELFERMGKEGGHATRNLLEFPGVQIPPGHGIGRYEVEKNRGVLQRSVDENLVTQGEVQRGEFSDALHKTLEFTEPFFLIGGSRGGAVDLVEELFDFGFDIRRHSVAVRSEERNESDLDAFVSGKDRNIIKDVITILPRV